MTRASATLIAACAALLLGGTAGCDSRYRVRTKGDTVYMPEASSMLRYERSSSAELPFVRFDGQYPREWPDGARLPEGSYLRMEGSLNGRRNSYWFMADFDGVCRGTPDSVAEDWRERIMVSGWSCSYETPDVKSSYPSGMADNYIKLFAEPLGVYTPDYAEIIVYRHSNMDGWVHYGGFVRIDNN